MFAPTRSVGLQALRAVKPIRFAAPVRQARFLNLRATPRMRTPVPKEEQSAHTISQRLRTLKKIPPELIPLGIVLVIAVGAAIFSITRKLYVDKTLRLSRQRGHDQ
ncbi:uncharacterized protein K452DRAFT_298724 [Aplosporella prunicola CBS 121167]|uniref:Uncharacterized protein n=1 Tax=Aplosporella prunicola CBS 121167 TaxID=1176127 RepID=A0A6A6BAU9_9PEZI|nr:uncharacterized protein K452DRAFT_298724 [Aplosporella prunicola CBS 121167]KAF2141339.1 hypothetical protein K452DRAFT_298724 [Aplosporella prunicola CBS 121167]